MEPVRAPVNRRGRYKSKLELWRVRDLRKTLKLAVSTGDMEPVEDLFNDTVRDIKEWLNRPPGAKPADARVRKRPAAAEPDGEDSKTETSDSD